MMHYSSCICSSTQRNSRQGRKRLKETKTEAKEQKALRETKKYIGHRMMQIYKKKRIIEGQKTICRKKVNKEIKCQRLMKTNKMDKIKLCTSTTLMLIQLFFTQIVDCQQQSISGYIPLVHVQLILIHWLHFLPPLDGISV